MNVIGAIVLLLLTADLKADLDSMVRTERAFAQRAMVTSVRESFLEFIDSEGVLFRPSAVAGKKWLKENPATTGLLMWEPAFADISRSGDLGYTTGPWENRHSISDTPRAYGQYVTIWKKQPDGTWKFVLNVQIATESPAPRPVRVESPLIAKKTAAPAKVQMDLLKMDSAYGIADLAADARIYRDGSLEKLSWKAVGAGVSNSADLAYTYGTAGKNNYLHIWKLQPNGGWKVVLDLLTGN
jgi:ketosteroid isomerase-like protein